MRKFRFLYFLLAVIMVTMFSGLAFGAGIEPGLDDPEDAQCLSSCGEPPGIKKRAPIITGSWELTLNPSADTDVQLDASLRYRGQVVPLEGAQIPLFGLTDVCLLYDPEIAALLPFEDERIREYLVDATFLKKSIEYSAIFVMADIEDEFELTGTPLVKQLVITERDCDAQILSGIIVISVVPTLPDCDLTNDPPLCWGE